MDRSAFLAGAGALAFGAAALGRDAEAQAPPGLFRLDVHHHLNPPFLAEATKPRRVPPNLVGWTPEKSLADMEKAGVLTAILSLPRSPSLFFGGDDASRRLTRRVNEYTAGLRRSYPGRFGFWAELPLPDVEGSVAEIGYALDTLGADGVALATSYGSKWLGDPSFAPMWEELNRRKAIAFTHPLANQCCVNQLAGLNDNVIEFGTDTTRTIASLVFSGTAARYPDVRIVFSHAGGTMPFLIERFQFQARDPKFAAALPHGVEYELKKFYYDTAQSSNPAAMGALLKLVPVSHVLFGTDFPYRFSSENVSGLAGCGLRKAELAAIDRNSALALLPRYRAAT
jgi:predicted TIM-barrel fold metal-dependent hydrolase